VKLPSVASKVLTQSGWLMIEALIDGQRDPAELANLAKGKLRPKIPELTEAMAGHFGAHHAVAARRILDHVDFLDATIAALTEQIDARTEPFQAAKQLLSSVPGFDRLVIDTVIAETGADMGRFPSPGHLAKWAGVCPGNHESAGKRRRVGITPGNSGCGAPLSKRPGPQPGRGVATSAHSTARSLSGAARTRPVGCVNAFMQLVGTRGGGRRAGRVDGRCRIDPRLRGPEGRAGPVVAVQAPDVADAGCSG
jgi:hypothetical protein